MSSRADLKRLARELDEGAQPSPELERRIDADALQSRRARALRRVDTLLRAELGAGARKDERSIAARVLPRLAARPRRRAVRRWMAVAAAAGLLVLARPSSSPPEPTPTPIFLPLSWSWIDPILAGPITPEQPLVAEARALADDTRHAARSLWSSLPAASWLGSPAWIFGDGR